MINDVFWDHDKDYRQYLKNKSMNSNQEENNQIFDEQVKRDHSKITPLEKHTIIKNEYGTINYHIIYNVHKFRYIVKVYVMQGTKGSILGYIPLLDNFFQYKEDKGRKPRNIVNALLTYFIDEFYLKEDPSQMLTYLNRIEDKDVNKKLSVMTLLGVFTETHEFTGERKGKEKHFDNGQKNELND